MIIRRFMKSGSYTPHTSVRYINADENGITKKHPVLYERRESCCGCSACFAVCPAEAISMQPDEEGFLYPVIDAEKCVGCRKCLNVCSFKSDKKNKGFPL